MRGHFYAAISPSEKYSPPRKHVKRLKMLKSLCPAVALALTLFSLPPRPVLPSRLRRFILTTACCRACLAPPCLPSIAARRLTAAPNHLAISSPSLCYHRRTCSLSSRLFYHYVLYRLTSALPQCLSCRQIIAVLALHCGTSSYAASIFYCRAAHYRRALP